MEYYCEHCKIIVKNSICPECGSRTIPLHKVYWCDEENVPTVYETCPSCTKIAREIGNDIRPVFPEERLIIELLLGKPLAFKGKSCWCISGGKYIIDGKIVRVKVKDLKSYDANVIREQYEKYSLENNDEMFEEYINRFININHNRYNEIVSEAQEYILEHAKNYDRGSMFVSFSGGKDSTVTSDLVMTTFGDTNILHIFGNTTLEFPETYDYVNRFKASHRKTKVFVAENKEKQFYELCDVIGPPSRVMRWCCTVFKTGAITKTINSLFKNKTRILTFYGIRRAESTSRSKYDRESDSPKITKQRTVSPIIDWYDVDVWLYILTRRIDFNEAYRKGFARVGCWCCPNNSVWSEFLSAVFHPEDYNQFRNMLISNAVKIGKPDPVEYVDTGKWKAKQGGAGLEISKKTRISFSPCALEENAFNYVLQKSISPQLYELFKPFGTLNFDMGNQRLGEVYILDKDGTVKLKLQGKIGQNELKVTIVNLPVAGSKSIKEAEGKVKCQLTKYQMCLNCSACVSICRFNAISIRENNGEIIYHIDENKCVHCHECINHFDSGCYMKKVLRIKNE